jgi:hypothetical protein
VIVILPPGFAKGGVPPLRYSFEDLQQEGWFNDLLEARPA